MPHVVQRKKTGFTLIELLVVITIIGVLAAVGMVSYSAAGKSARDARRKSDLETIRQALVMYRSEFGCYPNGGSMSDTIDILHVKKYLSNPLPQDPKFPIQAYAHMPGGSYQDCSDPDNLGGKDRFTIRAFLEKPAGAFYDLSSP